MKILYLCNNLYPKMGGAYKAITETYKVALSNSSFKCRLAVNNDGKSKKNIDLIFLIKNFDIIHYFGGWDWFNIKVMVLSIFFKKKLILTPMGIYDDWSLDQKKIKKIIALNVYQKFFLDKASILHVTSNYEKQNIEKLTKNNNIEMIPHGLKSNIHTTEKNFFIGEKKKALFFSRLHNKKGIIELIESWIRVNDNSWELHIYGPDYDKFRVKIKKIIENNKSIFIHDPVFNEEKKRQIFLKYDFFILPSKSENFGYVVVEALQAGLPVLTTNKTPWDSLKKSDAGWVIDSNLAELDFMLKKIFSLDKDDFIKKSNNAKNLSKKFVWDNLKEEYFLLYKRLWSK